MTEMEKLQTIKPKTLPENRFAYLHDRNIMLDFGTSRVVMTDVLDKKWPSARISIKDLFSGEFDNAQSVGDYTFNILSEDINEWITIPVNLLDVSAVNAPASAGEELWWHGVMRLTSNSWELEVSGLIYYMKHNMAKMNKSIDDPIVFPIDYHLMYYLNQMYKKVTKTKLQNLMIKMDTKTNRVYLSHESNEFYIEILCGHNEFVNKNKTLAQIAKAYDDMNFIKRENELNRIQYGKDKDSLIKHLTKAVGDVMSRSESDIAELFSSNCGKIYINKRK